MKTAERTAAPTLGNALGLFIGLWAINQFEWLPATEKEYIIIAMGTICIHLLQEFRTVFAWLKAKYAKPTDA